MARPLGPYFVMSFASIGLGGWMELHISWVRINDGAVFEEDGAVSGDYQILYDGIEAGLASLDDAA